MLKKPKMEMVRTDMLIIGGGLAGCWAAIKGKRHLDDVTLVDKGYVSRSSQALYAGIAQFPRTTLFGYLNICTPDDDRVAWLKEIIEVGEYINDQEWVYVHLAEVYDQVMELEKIGVNHGLKILQRSPDGQIVLRKITENAITSTSLVNGLLVMDALRKEIVKQRVRFLERVMITDLLVQDGRLVGALGINYRLGKIYLFETKAAILATAGCGFKSFLPGSMNLTGDGQAMAYDAGCVLRNMEHTASVPSAKIIDSTAIWVAVNYGARFLNSKDEEFMWKYSPVRGSKERLVRLGIAMAKESEQGNGPIFMDLSGIPPEYRNYLEERAPETLRAFTNAGINPFKDKIEYIPVFRGTNASSGGIHVNIECATNVDGLYAVGDSTCCPVQGTWSVLGLNLAFALISGARASKFASEYVANRQPTTSWHAAGKEVRPALENLTAILDRPGELTPDELALRIQEAIMPYDVCYLRNAQRLRQAVAKVEEIREVDFPRVQAKNLHELYKALEVRSMATVAEAMLKSALKREESRGSHYREDFPLTDNIEWLKWVMVRKGSDRDMEVFTEPFPTPYLEPPRERYEPR